MKKIILTLSCLFAVLFSQAQTDTLSVKRLRGKKVKAFFEKTKPRIPFDEMDVSWINGQNRQTHFPLQFYDKKGDPVISGMAYLDTYFNYDFNRPIDNTHTISSSIGRSNEFTVNMASFGVETNYKNVIGRLWLQFGQMGSIVQDLDATVNHGKNTAAGNLKFIREAAAGYHFNKWYGINIEAGIFMSYIGLESYVLNENWSYQRSMPCDFTPFYFSGARIQAYPTKKLKQEIWLLNGWQSYNSWNQQLGVGSSTYYRPNENLQLVANFYLAGHDTRNNPGLMRFHHDHSVVGRYYKNKGKGMGLSQAAVSINNHYGFQTGNGVRPRDQYFVGTSISNRLWFLQKKLGLTLRGDFVMNPGAYLAFTPSPVTDNDFNDALAAGKKLQLFQGTVTFDVMPNDFMTLRLEYGYRSSNIPYFSGRNGITSPDGWVDTPTNGWRPDLAKTEHRLTVAVNFRL